jgi:CRISPR-associated protein Cmr4
MTSHVKWVTCPALIKRFSKDLARLGLLKTTFTLPEFTAEQALTSSGNADLYLEEFRFETKATDLNKVLALIAQITGEQLEADLQQNLVIVTDNQFRHLCRNAVPVQAHIAIETATKTVKQGALWYEENLPSETVMYCCISATNGRNEAKQPEAALLGLLDTHFAQHNFIQVGGNLTTGMGWFEVNWVAEVKHG